MSEIANSMDRIAPAEADGQALERRIFRAMLIASGLAVIGSAAFAPWRITSGLFLGGVLALINHHWLRTSIAAVFNFDGMGKRPHIKASRFVVRYLIIGLVVFAAYQLNAVSFPATILGLTSFVVSLFAEAFRELYYAIIRREEID